jgi:hypothetical protein
VGYTQHGVCSYVYKAHLRGGGGAGPPLAIKVRKKDAKLAF